MSSRVDLEKLKLDTKTVLESLQKTIKSSDLYTPGGEAVALVRAMEELDTALGEEKLASVDAVNRRFSEDNMKQVSEQLESVLQHDRAWLHLQSAFPELALETTFSLKVSRLLNAAELLLASMRAQSAASVGSKSESKVLSSSGGFSFGPSASASVGQLLRVAPASDLPIKFSSKPEDVWTTLIRPSTASVLEELQRREASGFSKSESSLVLDGEKGCGKSVVLAHAVLWARAQGWLVLCLNGSSMVRGGRIVRSKLDPTLWDQLLTNRLILERFVAAEAETLKVLPIQSPNAFPLNAKKPFATLFDLVQYGATSEENSTAALLWLRVELALVKDRNVLVAVDDANALHNNSSYFDMDHKSFAPVLMSPRKLSGPGVFLDHHRQFFARGTSIVALSYRGGIPAKNFDKFDAKNPSKRFVVPKFSFEEFNSVLNEYTKSGASLSEVNRRYLYSWTGGNAGDLKTFANFL